jgi:hypothetical protein
VTPPAGGAAQPAASWRWWSHPGRRALHLLAIIAGWALFFWGWHRVLERGTDFSQLRLLMLGAAVVVPVITISWILHNRGIHRRKGPRRSVSAVTLEYRVDFNGREVVADLPGLAMAQRVDIVIDGGFKRYRITPAAQLDEGHRDPDRAAEARHAIDQASAVRTGMGAAEDNSDTNRKEPTEPRA